MCWRHYQIIGKSENQVSYMADTKLRRKLVPEIDFGTSFLCSLRLGSNYSSEP